MEWVAAEFNVLSFFNHRMAAVADVSSRACRLLPFVAFSTQSPENVFAIRCFDKILKTSMWGIRIKAKSRRDARAFHQVEMGWRCTRSTAHLLVNVVNTKKIHACCGQQENAQRIKVTGYSCGHRGVSEICWNRHKNSITLDILIFASNLEEQESNWNVWS